MRAARPVIPDPQVTFAGLGNPRDLRRLSITAIDEVAALKCKLDPLRLNDQNEVRGHGLAMSVLARDVKGRHPGLGRGARERQTARRAGELKPVGELSVVPRVLVRSFATRGTRNRRAIRAMRT